MLSITKVSCVPYNITLIGDLYLNSASNRACRQPPQGHIGLSKNCPPFLAAMAIAVGLWSGYCELA